ncbi:nucleoside-diphosphate kinase [bacterium]|nr:nucleoside-diphosphate kinase [bacterium]
MHEQTLVLIKPDAVQRGIIGKIIERFEQKGLKIVGLKMMSLDDALLREHYSHHADKPFFEGIKSFMMSSPVIALALEGLEACSAVRLIVGVTKSREATAGTIRGDFAMSIGSNVVHASESSAHAKQEVPRFFSKDELFKYGRCDYTVVYAEDEKEPK